MVLDGTRVDAWVVLLMFCSRLSRVTGAEIEKTPNMTTLRQFLSHTNILLILDNVETILDPHQAEAAALYSAVEELSQIKSIHLVVTTRISTVPTACRQVEVPALSTASAREVFYHIHATQERLPEIDSLLRQLDNHPLLIKLLATVAAQNRWDHSRLFQEWSRRRFSLLWTHNTSELSATIERSLSSPTFTNLGPGARDILDLIGFFPQGVNEDEVEWVFPTVPKIRDFIDVFCVLSLTRRNNGFITILAPLRLYLEQGCPYSLLPRAGQQYFTRIREIACSVGRNRVRLQQTQWLASEDINIDSLLSFYMGHFSTSAEVLRVCRDFANIAQFHFNTRRISSDHLPTTPGQSRMQYPRLTTTWITHLKEGYEAWEGDVDVVCALLGAALCNEVLGDLKRAISQAEEALTRCDHLGDIPFRARCHYSLALLLDRGGFFTEATKAVRHAIDLYTDMGDPLKTFECHLLLAKIFKNEDNLNEAKDSLITAFKIIRRLNKKHEFSKVLSDLGRIYLAQGNRIVASISLLWSKAVDKAIRHDLQSGEELLRKSRLSFMRGDLEETKAEANLALEIFSKIGDMQRQESTQRFRRLIQWELNESPVSPFVIGELPELWNLATPRPRTDAL